MQQAQGITSVFVFAILTSILPPAAFSKPSGKPVEVISDPYGVGNPTKYSILRDNSKVTFSHPLKGQFTRAEITTREKNGILLTRFLISRDRKTYRPVLSFLTPFETHYSTKDEKICVADPTPLATMIAIAPKAIDGEIIAKKRDELTKSNFFHPSCFDTSIPLEHRNAIMNAAADVLSTKTQDVTPEPKYLRCLEKFGFAHESGTIQALEKISKANPKNVCKIRLACTSEDLDDGQAKFDEKECLVTLQTTPIAERESYARLIFHELAHTVPVRDGTPLTIIEECCAKGKKCDVLKAFADRNRIGEKTSTIVDASSQKNTVITSSATILAGQDGADAALASASDAIKLAERVSISQRHDPIACQALGPPECTAQLLDAYESGSYAVQRCFARPKEKTAMGELFRALLILEARADNKPLCGSDIHGETYSSRPVTQQAMADSRPKVDVEAIERLDQTSPITWDIPKEETSIRLASSLPADDTPRAGQGSSIGHTPTRTIASIEPLPDEAPQRSLGSVTNRRDVSSGRATVLVDTVERAARKVAQTLTPEKVELLQVDRKEIFEADYKPKTKSPHYFVTSSAANPIQVADIGNIQGLSFPNPFANSLPAQGKTEAKLAKSESDANSKLTKATKTSGTVTEKEGTGVKSESGTSLTAAVLRNSRATTQAGSFAPETREPSAARTHDFKSMDRTALVRFLTSGYRIVSAELENPDLAKALADERNRIQVHDHENRQIGSMKPEITFIYSSDVGRLVQTRVNREKK
jgi:hypothetical protein